MEEKNYVKILVEDIHTTVVATVDKEGKPVTTAMDMMDYDEDGIYFLTARGKSIYDRLKDDPYISLTGLKGESTIKSISISLTGEAVEIGTSMLPALFDKNPYMYKIYPTVFSRDALTVFRIQNIKGEFFDLSKKPIERASFALGKIAPVETGYYVEESECIGCRVCLAKCPEGCIDLSSGTAKIKEENCLQCGNCYDLCPVGAIIKRG